jgi:pyruvate formate lyase activating enzyme
VGDILAWEDFRDYLSQRTGWIDGVSITGGEPTLHTDLHLLCKRIRDLEMMVKLDTNGSHPHMLRDLLARGLLDFVAMDVKASPINYRRAAGRQLDVSIIEESIDIILGSGIEHEFRCTVVPGLVNLADLEWIAKRVAGSRGLILQQFKPGKTLDPAYSDKKGYADEMLREWSETLSRWSSTTVRGLVGVS